MYEKSNQDVRRKFEASIPSVFRSTIPSPYIDDIRTRFQRVFETYRQHQWSATLINVVHFHHLHQNPDYRDLVLDHISQFVKSEAFEFCTGLMGDSIVYPLTISQIRVQFPSVQMTHVPLHQDLAFTGVDYPVINAWVPLVDCGEEAPGLEFIDRAVSEDLTDLVQTELSDYEMFRAIDLTSNESFLRQRYKGDLVAPRLRAGDCLVFDQFALHRTYVTPSMTKPRFSLELRGFSAEHLFRNPDRWLRDRANAEVIVATKGGEAVYLSSKSISRIVNPSRATFQRPSAGPEADRRLGDLVGTLETERAAVRNRDALRAFLETAPYRGRCYVYPLGRDTRDVLPTLAATSGLQVLGVVDRRAAELSPYDGHEVIRPEDLAGRDFDRVLVPHVLTEQARALCDQLRSVGVPEDRIVNVYEDPRFVAFGVDRKVREVAELVGDPGGIDHVIIRETRSHLVDDGMLRTVLPPERTLVLLLGHVVDSELHSGYRMVAAEQSLRSVRAVLQHLKPRSVYLQGSIDTHFMAYLVKDALPGVRLVHELYDLWMAISEFPLARFAAVCHVDDRMTEVNRLGESFSLRHATAVVSKRFGGDWRTGVIGEAVYAPYYPMIGDARPPAAAPTPTTGDRLRLVDATSLMQPEMVRQEPDVLISYAPFDLMEPLAAIEPVTFDVYNAFHSRPDQDDRFAEYMLRYDRGAIRYHRGVDIGRLVEVLAGYDYGWLNVAVPLDHPDAPHVALNRFTAYVAAGLPVIVNARLAHVAGLIERFNAGVVSDGATVEATRRALRRIDPQAHRAGALSLHAYLQAENRRSLDLVRAQL